MQKVKWGILGTANVARWGMIPGMKKATNCELYAIAGRNAEKAKAFQEQYGFEKAYGSYDELLADENVQAVYIPLPNDIHLKWVKAALKAGKHVLCEKPMAMNAQEMREMFQTAKECGKLLMEAYAYLHSPYVEALCEDIKSGIIGEVNYIDTAFVTQGYKEDFRLHKELGGGAMYDLGCYCTTMILTLAKAMEEAKNATAMDGLEPTLVKACAEFTDLDVDFLTAGLIRLKNGIRASFNVGMNLGENSNSRYDRLFIHGSKGSIRSEVEYNQEGNISYKIYTPEGVVGRNVFVPHNYCMEVEQLGRCILDGETPHVTPEFSIRNAELMDRLLIEMGY
ncbi:MAG: Gfo/Idh/MocA family oxidoreductase [Lachnospiraceae bacterium]|nr:Gfo/Idh/MocA family oxidoreductase [Lachnospiraceae bacterium]